MALNQTRKSHSEELATERRDSIEVLEKEHTQFGIFWLEFWLER